MKYISRVFLVVALILSSSLSFAQTEVITTKIALDEMKTSLTEAADQAADRMDYTVALAAIKALQAIQAWEQANSNLLDQGFDRLDQASLDMFARLNATLNNANQIASTALDDLHNVTTNINLAAENIITGDKRSYILKQEPLVIPPTVTDDFTVRLTGVNLDRAEFNFSIAGKPIDPQIHVIGPKEVQLTLSKNLFPSSDDAMEITDINIQQRSRNGSYLLLFPKYENVERQIRLAVMPNTVGTISGSITRDVELTQRRTHLVNAGKFKGTNKTIKRMVNPTHGWKWDVSDLSKFSVVSTGKGEAAKCHKHIIDNGVTPDGITISARVDRIKEFHFPKFKITDGYISCGLKGPMIRTTESSKDFSIEPQILTWTSDLEIILGDDAKSFSLQFTTFDGKTHIITAAHSDSPYFEVEKSTSSVIIRPKEVTDII